MLSTIALIIWVVCGLAFVFTVLIIENHRNSEEPEQRILREAEAVVHKLARRLRIETPLTAGFD